MKLASILLAFFTSVCVLAVYPEEIRHCTNIGGTHVALEVPNGSPVGYCWIDRGLIASRTLYVEMMEGKKTIAVQRFLMNAMNRGPRDEWPDHAANHYCRHIGGYTLTAYDLSYRPHHAKHPTETFCRFRDGSTISVRTLYEGSEEHKALARLLSP